MDRFGLPTIFMLICTVILLGCSTGDTNPLVPAEGVSNPTIDKMSAGSANSTQLWGYFEIYIDIENETAEVIENRSAMYSANVVDFLNSNPLSMSFKINEIIIGTGYTEVDIDVGITHPFPGMPEYNGYDVRGIFMGNGSAYLSYNPDLIYPVQGPDQMMYDDPDSGPGDFPGGGPDGYTRWFNIGEFSEGGLPMFNYTPGNLALEGFSGPAALCPYKYFADTLGTEEDLWVWLTNNPGLKGIFSSGATNVRNYYLRFPDDLGIVYGYAVIANWEGEEPGFHPSNAVEAVGCDVTDNSNVYYIDPSDNGGSLILDISVFDWASEVSAGVMEDYNIWVESTVLSSPYQLDQVEMTPPAGDENYSTYHVEISADNITGVEGNEYWVIIEYPDYNYSNEFGVINLAADDPLAAFFRCDLSVSTEPTTQDPMCDLFVVTNLPAEGWDSGVPVEFDATGSNDPDGDPLSFDWDFDGDGIYNENPDDLYEGQEDNPTHYYTSAFNDKAYVRVSDGNGGESICNVDVDVIVHPSKNIELHSSLIAKDIAIDHTNGDLSVLFTDGSTEQVWKYSRSDWYQVGNHFFNSWFATTNAWAIDVSPNQHTVTTGDYASGQPLTEIVDPNGNMLYPVSQGGVSTPSIEVFAMAAGDFTNDVGNILGWPSANATFAIRYPDGNWFYGHTWHYYYPTIYTGIDEIYFDYIVGVESDSTGNFLWYLEDDPEYYAARWELSNSGFPYSQTYDNAYFGTGSQTDDDDGWNLSKDITRDNQNYYFVLDELSTGVPRIKMWSVAGDTTTSIGGFGDSISISGEPLRIEGSNWSGEIVVLHGDSAPYMVSVFCPNEIPD